MFQIGKPAYDSHWTSVGPLNQIRAGVRRLVDRRRARRMAATLERLDDAILRDIGISRAEIPAVARRITARPRGPHWSNLALNPPARQAVTT